MNLFSVTTRQSEKLMQWALPMGIVTVWEALSLAGLIPPRILPAPTAVIAAAWKLTLSGELLRNIWVSFWRAIVGLAIGGGIGFALGLANGLSRPLGTDFRHHPANDPQYSASRAHSTGYSVVWH